MFPVVGIDFVLIELVDTHMAATDILDKKMHVGHNLDEVDIHRKIALAYHNLDWEHCADVVDSTHACRAEGCYVEKLCS